MQRVLAAVERDYREALRIARAFGAAEGVAVCTGNLAELALHREDWPEAEARAREALALSEKLGRQKLIAEDCRRLAQALVRQGKAAEALPTPGARWIPRWLGVKRHPWTREHNSLRANTGWAPATAVELKAWQPSR